MIKKFSLFILYTLTIVLPTILVLLNINPNYWDSLTQATCMPINCFCEKIHLSDSIRQPSNTWSSLAYVIAGCYIFSRISSNKNEFTSTHQLILAVSSIVIGIGSAFYHASLSFIGQFFDVFGMYLLTLFMLVYIWQRIFNWTNNTSFTIYFILNTVSSLALIFYPETRRFLFAIFLIIALFFEFYAIKIKSITLTPKYLIIGISIFAVSYIIWILDNSKIICFPESIIQGHSIWHLLGALAVVFLSKYYSQKIKSK